VASFVLFVFLLVWFLAGRVTLCLLFEFGYKFVGETVITCNGLYGFPLICSSFFRKWYREHSVDVIMVQLQAYFL